jgi:NADPH-dependent 7-cyano-7-deazaguanine reductase QueF-like protein
MKNYRQLWITSKDVQHITERSPRYARRLLERIRRELKKDKLQAVSVEEFCKFMGYDIEFIYTRLGYSRYLL